MENIVAGSLETYTGREKWSHGTAQKHHDLYKILTDEAHQRTKFYEYATYRKPIELKHAVLPPWFEVRP